MFITTKTQTIPSVSQSRDLPGSATASARPQDESGYDDGLVHNHDWANERRENGPVGMRPERLVADTSSVPTPSSAVHDDLHYS
ncbi:hypothetical protein MVG78_00690 [Roseomonas gilardii subsp. gilardii]|uniref:hypothetical protein n=1 Tax=Roseomonas gilardii TaxID=257708 RepID=UPI001FF77AF5|nr:hypothetical protein [Roseomonas gilardii]UPG72754.1 hypothetical protein MVG78_00690 [Roseomonas gilardii subsp. gilardii]